MKRHTLAIITGLVFGFGTSSTQTSLNVTLFGTLNPIPVRYSGCWGWTSPSGNEYALLGGFEGTHVISIDDSLNIYEADFVDGQNSNWREITVIGDHAFVVTEGAGDLQGMQVIDLSPLPDSVHPVATYTQTFTRGHIISRDLTTDSAYVYVSGTSTTGGVHILDVSDPGQPTEIGLYDPPYYIHDAHVRGNLMFAAALGTGLDIVDISDKTSPQLIGEIDHPSQFTHSSMTTDDGKHIVVTDEVDGLPARIWNIENLDSPQQVAQYSANLQSLVHNPYVLGDLLFVSHNTEGLRVIDISVPSVPVEVGYYDTYAGPSGGFNGLWSAYPYFPSGKIIGGNREDGLYVWRFNGTRAGRVFGNVTDSLTCNPLAGVLIRIMENDTSDISDSAGSFALGALPSGPQGYTVEATLANYHPSTLSGFILNEGDSIWLEVRLSPSVTSSDESMNPPPTGFTLEQNYPNPFNSGTTIQYSIETTTHIRVAIYDPLGRMIRQLVDEPQERGTKVVSWNGLDNNGDPVSSGIYLYRLEAKGRFLSKALVLLR
jgi:choice-of-anchor B domain-containing protein